MRPRMAPAQDGFTLLEVLIALAILAAALLVITRAQSQGIVVSRYQDQQITAATLARWKMVELELQLEKDGFPSDDKEECGNFGEDLSRVDIADDLRPDPVYGLDLFEYCWTLTKVELPLPFQSGDDAAGAAGGAGGGAPAGNQPTLPGLDPEAVSEQLSKAVRALTLVVKWKTGELEQQLPVTMHLVNTTQTGVLP